MATILGMGLSHYPGPLVPGQFWPRHLQTNVERGRIPEEVFIDRASWPQAMIEEWGADDGLGAALEHERRLLAGYRNLRNRIDDFEPDLVLIWGDDQYENFKKDCIPPFCLYLGDQVTSRPVQKNKRGAFRTSANSWGIAEDTEFTYRCHSAAATDLTEYLLAQNFDMSYAYATKSETGLSHSFANTIMYLDYDQSGFEYPIVPFHVNCYGRELMTTSAGVVGESLGKLSPPSPSPQRCFALGQQVARHFAQLDLRVVLMASSSWSHASLTAKHQRLYPDLEADRARYADIVGGQYSQWGELDADAIEQSGQNEILNWICLAGAMTELGATVDHSELIESYIFNSSKCFVAFDVCETRELQRV